MGEDNFLRISWQEVERDCFRLAKQVIEKKLKPDRIIAIGRGGLVVGRLMSDFLSLPVSTFGIAAYTGVNKPGEAEIIEELVFDPKDKRVLLVDEIVDHGKTLACAVDYLSKRGCRNVYTLAPYVKPHARPIPDFWIRKTDRWVVFPYDTRETIADIVEVLKKQKFSLARIRLRLLAMGFDKEQLSYFLEKMKT